MALHWSSWESFVDHTHPSMLKSPDLLSSLASQSTFITIIQLEDSRRRLDESLQRLSTLGYADPRVIGHPLSRRVLEEGYNIALHVIRAGEELLLNHERLARSDAAYGFLHQNDLPKHWQRYLHEGNPSYEIYRLYQDASALLDGFTKLIDEDQRLLVAGLQLPADLDADFRTARSLFSLGFDEVGLLVASRGLERVLRQVAKARRITIESKNAESPAWDADLYDLIEVLFRVRWKASNEHLIDAQSKALLHYLRSRRNVAAHPSSRESMGTLAPREAAIIAARTAQSLWAAVSATRALLSPRSVKKTW